MPDDINAALGVTASPSTLREPGGEETIPAMNYIIKIGDQRIGPLTEYQVLAKFEAGEIPLTTRIAVIESPDSLDKDDCVTLQHSNLYKTFDDLRAISSRPMNYYLDQIAKNQLSLLQALRAIRWAIVGFSIWFVIQFWFLPKLIAPR